MSNPSFIQEGQILFNLDDLINYQGQDDVDFGLPKKTVVTDEIASIWVEAKIHWSGLSKAKAELSEDKLAIFTRENWVIPFMKLLGYNPVYNFKTIDIDNKRYNLSHSFDSQVDAPKLHIVPLSQDLDKRQDKEKQASPHLLMQRFLNETEHLWGVVTNGHNLRVLRDSSLIGQSSYLEVNLEQIMTTDSFAEFLILYRILHRTRFPKTSEDSALCLLEKYYQLSQEQGSRVRESLRDGVEKAIQILGDGLLREPKNEYLTRLIEHKELSGEIYYRTILQLIYKLLFLMVAEARNLLFVGEDKDKKQIYDDYYSIERFRQLAELRGGDSKDQYDLWEGLKNIFALFDENSIGSVLGLGAIDSELFCFASFKLLRDSWLSNEFFLNAIDELSCYYDYKKKVGVKKRVNYAALDVEELGSVYESLLEYYPVIESKMDGYYFTLLMGSERKSTGSYYTPAGLVGKVLDESLMPVIQNCRKSKDAEQKLLALKVIDPACGSGHFLLAATRKIAHALSEVRKGEDQPTPEDFRRAKREVIANCIYGVDVNPLAVDLCKVALWIESYDSGKPLSFLDHRIKVGNSLVGVFSLEQLQEGIPSDAYKANAGEDKPMATLLRKQNEKDLMAFQNIWASNSQMPSMQNLPRIEDQLNSICEDTPSAVHQKETAYFSYLNSNQIKHLKEACQLWTTAFFVSLTADNQSSVPSIKDINDVLQGKVIEKLTVLQPMLDKIKPFHWFLEFVDVMRSGGFDVVVGNPPWEKIKIQEKEFFALRDPEVANAINASARKELIAKLKTTKPKLFYEFEQIKRLSEKTSQFLRKSTRYPLTAQGDINTYALFAESFSLLIKSNGRAGIVVPTGIATDNGCKDFWGALVDQKKIISLFDFENKNSIFPNVHRSFKFSILTIGNNIDGEVRSAFFLTSTDQLSDSERTFNLNIKDYERFNPNTKTSPIFRSRMDYKINHKVYQQTGVLWNEKQNWNNWGITFCRLFDMSNDSHLFKTQASEDSLPLYEAKMFWHYDHRNASFTTDSKPSKHKSTQPIENEEEEQNTRYVTEDEKQNPTFEITPRYWVCKDEVKQRLEKFGQRSYLIAFRDITNVTNERTVIASVLPCVGVGHNAPLAFTTHTILSSLMFVANLNSIILDYFARQKIGGTHLTYIYLKQLPILPPQVYSDDDQDYLLARLEKLIPVSNAFQELATELKWKIQPITEEERHQLKCEIDAFYAYKYQLTREELLYILDPQAVMGENFFGETFRVLQDKENKKFGEYRTKRLVLEAWDKLQITYKRVS